VQKNLSGVADMEIKPGALVIIDICGNKMRSRGCPPWHPIVAMVDTNADQIHRLRDPR
jgi:ribosomal protein S2